MDQAAERGEVARIACLADLRDVFIKIWPGAAMEQLDAYRLLLDAMLAAEEFVFASLLASLQKQMLTPAKELLQKIETNLKVQKLFPSDNKALFEDLERTYNIREMKAAQSALEALVFRLDNPQRDPRPHSVLVRLLSVAVVVTWQEIGIEVPLGKNDNGTLTRAVTKLLSMMDVNISQAKVSELLRGRSKRSR
jgi:hypothetical protein